MALSQCSCLFLRGSGRVGQNVIAFGLVSVKGEKREREKEG